MKIELGPLLSDARNAIGNLTKRIPKGVGPHETFQGGIIISRAVGGLYSRARMEPLNPNSIPQQAARATIRACTVAWQSSLTDLQRLAWNQAALSQKNNSAIKGSGTLAGFSLFCRLNAPLSRHAYSLLTDPPARLAPLYARSLSIVTNESAGPTLVIDLDPPPPANFIWQIFACPPQSPGRMSPWARPRLICAIEPADPLPVDITAPYTDAFGPPLTGTKLAVLASTLNTLDGSLSLRLRVASITT